MVYTIGLLLVALVLLIGGACCYCVMRIGVVVLTVVVLTVVVLWCCGVVVLWCCGVVVLWCCGVEVLWCRWCCGVVVSLVFWWGDDTCDDGDLPESHRSAGE
jgi:hypothetical protein